MIHLGIVHGVIMHIELIGNSEQLITEDSFAIYKRCMYKPTYEAYSSKMIEYANDKNTKIFVCFIENKLVGIIVLKLTNWGYAELIGIAVCNSFQNKGIGSFLVKQSANKMELCRITAETDDDAVGFYKKLGFDISKEIKHYANGKVVCYRCSLTL